MQGIISDRALRVITMGFVLLLFALWCMNIVMPDLHLIGFVSDDAYYYLETADRIARGEGSTFDGINPTNGYHPFWMLICVLLRLIFLNLEKLVFLRLILVVQAAMTLLAIWLLWKVLSESVGLLAALGGVALFMGGLFRPITGLETAVLVLALTVTTWLICHEKSTGWIGLGLAFITMSRLDYGLFAISLGIAAVWNRRASDGQYTIASIAADAVKVYGIPALVGVMYLLLNLVIFGHPLPVTFYIKSVIPSNLELTIPVTYRSRAVYLVLLAGFWIGLIVRRTQFLRMVNSVAGRLGVLFSIGTAVHFGYLMTLQYATARWHMIPYGVGLAFMLALIVDMYSNVDGSQRSLTRWLPGLAVLGVASLSLLTSVRVAARTVSIPEDNPSVQLYDMARWVQANTEPDEVIALADAGIVGYFGERSVVNLDGLINSYATVEAVQAGRLCSLMDEWQIDYLTVIQYGLEIDYQLDYSVPGWSAMPAIFQLTPSDELYRTDESGQYHVVIWDYDREQCEISDAAG